MKFVLGFLSQKSNGKSFSEHFQWSPIIVPVVKLFHFVVQDVNVKTVNAMIIWKNYSSGKLKYWNIFNKWFGKGFFTLFVLVQRKGRFFWSWKMFQSLETNQANRTTWTLPHTLGVPSVDPSLPKQCLLTFVFNQIVCLKLKYLCPLSISTKYWTDQIIRICCSIGFRQLLTHGIIIFISVTADYYNPDWRYLINWFVKWSFI